MHKQTDLADASDPADTPEQADRADRRIQRTRRMLNEAILALIVERPYDAITVRDITARADVNRATFYHHYQSKDELLNAALSAQFDALVASFEAIPNDESYYRNHMADILTFRHVEQHAQLYRVLLGEQGPPQIAFHMTLYVAAICRKLIERAEGGPLHYPVDALAHHMAGSLIGMARWWLLNNMPCSVEEVAAMSHALCIFGVTSASALDASAAHKAVAPLRHQGSSSKSNH